MRERGGVDRLGGKRLPLRTHGHDATTSEPNREYYHSRQSVRNLPWLTRTSIISASSGVSPTTRSRATRAISRALAAFAAGRDAPPERARPRGARGVRAAADERAGCRRARSRARWPPFAGFYRFLVLDRRLERSPADDLQPPRAWPALPKFLSLEEVDRLIAQPDVSTPLGLRDRAMIELLYATGMRVSELIGVRSADLHLDEHYLTCIGKGNKERLIPIGEQASDWITRYQRDGRRVLAERPIDRTRCSSTRAAGRSAASGSGRSSSGYGRRARSAAAAQPARAAAFVRDASARARRRPARDPDDARPRRSVDHADLHARARSAAANRSTIASTRGRDSAKLNRFRARVRSQCGTRAARIPFYNAERHGAWRQRAG